MEEKECNLYEKIMKMYSIKKEFADYAGGFSNTINIPVIENHDLIENIRNNFLNSLNPNKGIAVASYMYKNPNFFEFKSYRRNIGCNYILSVTGEGKNAYLYSQKIGEDDQYCMRSAFYESEKYNNYAEQLLFFRQAFLLSALAFEKGTQEERYNWEILLNFLDGNLLGFIMAKGREYGKELVNNMNAYMSSIFTINGIFDKFSTYNKYSIFSRNIESIETIKIEEKLNEKKVVKCVYELFNFCGRGDAIYKAKFERNNSFSKNFFPSSIKVNTNGEVIPEEIDFGRISNPNLTIKNREVANGIITGKLAEDVKGIINGAVDKTYSNFEGLCQKEGADKDLLFSNFDLMYSSISYINKLFNSTIINVGFMQ